MIIKTQESTIQNSLMMSLKNELPVLRARLGASQEIIAKDIGISRQAYNSIETGKKEMTWTIFLSLVTIFKSNEKTLQMLNQIPDFFENLHKVIVI